MGRKIERFEDLEVWQKAMQVAVDIYRATSIRELKGDFWATGQIRGAAMSISSNIAEGFEYNNNKEFIRFLKYAKGSAGEARSQLYVLRSLGFVKDTLFDDLYSRLIEISQQIANFMKYLRKFQNGRQNHSNHSNSSS